MAEAKVYVPAALVQNLLCDRDPLAALAAVERPPADPSMTELALRMAADALEGIERLHGLENNQPAALAAVRFALAAARPPVDPGDEISRLRAALREHDATVGVFWSAMTAAAVIAASRDVAARPPADTSERPPSVGRSWETPPDAVMQPVPDQKDPEGVPDATSGQRAADLLAEVAAEHAATLEPRPGFRPGASGQPEDGGA